MRKCFSSPEKQTINSWVLLILLIFEKFMKKIVFLPFLLRSIWFKFEDYIFNIFFNKIEYEEMSILFWKRNSQDLGLNVVSIGFWQIFEKTLFLSILLRLIWFKYEDNIFNVFQNYYEIIKLSMRKYSHIPGKQPRKSWALL